MNIRRILGGQRIRSLTSKTVSPAATVLLAFALSGVLVGTIFVTPDR